MPKNFGMLKISHKNAVFEPFRLNFLTLESYLNNLPHYYYMTWVAKFKLNHKDCPMVSRAPKFKADVISWPGEHIEENGKHAVVAHSKFVEDNPVNQEFLSDVKNDPRILKVDASGNSFTYKIDLGYEGEAVALYYDPSMSLVKPVMNMQDGFEYWEVASEDKDVLKNFFNDLTAHMDKAEILRISQHKITNILVPAQITDLSDSQKKAFALALKHGYYTVPRRITLEALALKQGICLSTFQEHLRKAESKILTSVNISD